MRLGDSHVSMKPRMKAFLTACRPDFSRWRTPMPYPINQLIERDKTTQLSRYGFVEPTVKQSYKVAEFPDIAMRVKPNSHPISHPTLITRQQIVAIGNRIRQIGRVRDGHHSTTKIF
ncbi:hypothetical protein [uncultured Duncaniella sp.]|uniref:hypothetical protein n=1 Tax=uncultured Duncaniella sp. TaxID=2768039 RepID=UPI0025A97E61|nr:hypothetical protein [uncultured Duncaniella sp.]